MKRTMVYIPFDKFAPRIRTASINLIEVLNRRASAMVMGLFKQENLQGKQEQIVSLADQAIELYTAYGLVAGAEFNGLYERIQRHDIVCY